MPLNPNTLKSGILAIVASFPPTHAAARIAWAAAFAGYFAEQAVPPWTPAALLAAQAAFIAEWDPLDKPKMEDAIDAFATALALLPPPGWVAVPPPLPMTLPPLPPTFDANAPATATANAVDAWARTGTASSGGAPVPWS